MWLPGRKLVVNLADGSSLSGVTRFSWLGRLRLRDVQADGQQIPGTVIIFKRSILVLQVVTDG